MDLNELFQARDDAERLEDAVQNLLLSCKFAIQRVMQEGGVSKRELSERLGVTPARVSQILADTNANMTIKSLGKIAHALGHDFELVSKSEYRGLLRKVLAEDGRRAALARPKVVAWKDHTANLNKFPQRLAA